MSDGVRKFKNMSNILQFSIKSDKDFSMSHSEYTSTSTEYKLEGFVDYIVGDYYIWR